MFQQVRFHPIVVTDAIEYGMIVRTGMISDMLQARRSQPRALVADGFWVENRSQKAKP